MDQMKHNAIDELEADTRNHFRELTGNDTKKQEIIAMFLEELNYIFLECKEWMKTNMDPVILEPRIQKLKEDSEKLFFKAKEKVQAISERPDVKEKIQDGKEMVIDVSSKVAHVVSEGTQELLKQENVRRVIDNVSEKMISIKNDERVKEGVASLKKGTLKVAEGAFNSLKKILDDETTDEHKQ